MSTCMDSACPPDPCEAGWWRIVRCGEAFRIQNMYTKEWMYADAPKLDDKCRRVLTVDHGGADPPQGDLSYLWHIVPYGLSFGIKHAKHDEWLFADGPTSSKRSRCVLAQSADPKAHPQYAWFIEAFEGAGPRAQCAPSAQAHTLLAVESSGYDCGNAVAFRIGEDRITWNHTRGLNVATLAPVSLAVRSRRAYDIYGSYGERNQFALDIESLPHGTVVMLALKDSGMEKLGHGELRALRGVGATNPATKYREGYALIGVKGGQAWAEARGGAVAVSAMVEAQVRAEVTLKVKHWGAFYRIALAAGAGYDDFRRALRSALLDDGLQAVYIDDEGDRCVLNEATFAHFLTSAGPPLKLELEAGFGGVLPSNLGKDSPDDLPSTPSTED